MGTTDGVDDGGETGLSQDNISNTASSIAPSTAIPMLARDSASAAGTVTGRGAKVTEALETLDDPVPVLG